MLNKLVIGTQYKEYTVVPLKSESSVSPACPIRRVVTIISASQFYLIRTLSWLFAASKLHKDKGTELYQRMALLSFPIPWFGWC